MMKKYLAILALFAAFLAANDIKQLTVENLEKMVLERNPAIKAAENLYKGEKEKILSAYLPENPSIGIMLDPMEEMYSGKGFMLYQKISFPLKYKYRGEAAKIRTDIYKELARKVEVEVVAEAKMVFYDYLYVHKSLLLTQKIKDLLKKYINIAQSKYQTGKSTLWDPLKAEVELSTIDAQIEMLEALKTSAKAKLAALMNIEDWSQIGDPVEPPLEKVNLKKEELLKTAYTLNPILRAKLKEAELNRKLYSLSKLDLIPDFGFQIERRTIPGMWMGKIMIFVPIFFPYKEVKKIKAAKHKVEATEKEIFNLKNIIAAELRDAIVTIKSAEKQLEIYRKRSIPKVLEALRSAESGYTAGITDFLVLIDTEKQYLKLEMMYWKARSDLGKGLTKLEKILAIRNLSALKEIKR